MWGLGVKLPRPHFFDRGEQNLLRKIRLGSIIETMKTKTKNKWFKIDEKAFHHEFFTLWWKLKKSGWRYRKNLPPSEYKNYKALCKAIFYENMTEDDVYSAVEYLKGSWGDEKPPCTGSADYMIKQIPLFNATDPKNDEAKRQFRKCGYDYEFYREVMLRANQFMEFTIARAAKLARKEAKRAARLAAKLAAQSESLQAA